MAGPIRIAVLANAAQAKREFADVQARGQRFGKVVQAGARVAAVGLLALGAAGVKAGQAAAEDEASQSRLAQTLTTAAHATDGQISSNERWITSMGKSLGVADDELRPAIARLATATGSVEKAQALAKIGMDVAAGSGKSLTQVTTALAKAQATGSVTALAKYGVATKDAQGKTKSLSQVTSELAAKYRGAAAKSAETTAGKQKILTVQLGELQETIGAKLLPVMNKLASAGLAAVDWATKHGTAAKVLLGVFVGLAAILITASVAMRIAAAASTISAAATGAAAIAQGVYAAATGAGTVALAGNTVALKAYAIATRIGAAAQWALNLAMTANPIGLVILAIVAFVAVIILAWKKSETFRNIITGAWNAIKKATGAAFDFVKAKVSGAINAIKNIFLNFTGPGLIIKHWTTIKNATSAAWQWVKSKTSAAWQALVGIIRDKVGAAVARVRALKDRIIGIFSGAAGWLSGAGRRIIDGLLGPLRAGADRVRSILSGITSKIPDWKGPAAKDKRLLRPAGSMIIDGLITGFESKVPDVRRTMTSLTREVERFDAKPTATLRVRAVDALGEQLQASSDQTITVTLTAQQVSDLEQGRKIQMKLNAYNSKRVGR